MPDENASNEIGEPLPVDEKEGWSVLARFVSFAIVISGGVAAFAVMTAPTHVRGATASSRLKWQQVSNPPESEVPAVAPSIGSAQ